MNSGSVIGKNEVEWKGRKYWNQKPKIENMVQRSRPGSGRITRTCLVIITANMFLLLILSPGISTGYVPKPVFHTGDKWEYTAALVIDSSLHLSGAVRMEIVGTQLVYVNGSAYDTVVNQVEGNGTFDGLFQGAPAQGLWQVGGMEFWDIASHERVKTNISILLDGEMDLGFALQNFTMNIEETTTSRIVSDGWNFPIDVMSEGTTVLQLTYAQHIHVEVEGAPPSDMDSNVFTLEEVTYRCLSRQMVNVEGAEYEVYTIRRTDSLGNVEVNDYYPSAGAGARIRRYDSSGNLTSEWKLLSFSYQGDIESQHDHLSSSWPYIVAVGIAVGVTVGSILYARRVVRRGRF